MHLSSIPSQSQTIMADITCQGDLSPKNSKRKQLPIDESLRDDQKSLHHRKTRKIATLAKPEGYFAVGANYKISLMKDFLHDNTQHFSDDDWLYLIIKMGKRAIDKNKLETLKKEFSTTDKDILFNKMATLQSLRYRIEHIVHHSNLKRRDNLYKAAQENKYLFPAGSLEKIIELAKNNHSLQFRAAPELLHSIASLDYDSHNPFFSELIIACYRNSHFSPPDIEMGHKIEIEIKNQTAKKSTSQESLEIESMLLDKATTKKVCGGRTIQLSLPDSHDNQKLYLKFQRKDESWDQFTRELKMHNALHKLFSDQDFASEIPVSKGLFSLPLSKGLSSVPLCKYFYSIPADEIIGILEDDLEISEGHLQGYCFAASGDYVNYACQPDPSNPKNPYSRSEEGLKKAAMDIGKYARYGLTFDSLIKSQHSKGLSIIEGIPKWMTLAQLSNINSYNEDPFPGSIIDWIKDTERSDLSWSGLRDLGDSQIFETTLHSLDPENALNFKFFPKVGNLLAYFNALMDNFIAIVIVYARGKRISHEFHYQNPVAVKEVKQFIRDILEHFLRGYYSSNGISLPQALGLDNTAFEQWLNRTALEIIYWSALQLYEMTGDFLISRHNHPHDNYFQHISISKRPNPDIMKTSEEMNPDFLSPYLHGRNHSFGLIHGKSFPLQALIKGLCKLSINMVNSSLLA